MEKPLDGASFDDIVHYVLENMRITQSRARYLVLNILRTGIALGRIKRTPQRTYILISKHPGPVALKIREPRFSDDSNDPNSSDDSG